MLYKNYDLISVCIAKWSYCLVIVCCSCSVAKLCLTLCDSVDHSMPGFPVLHHLLEFTQIYVYWVGDAIQLYHTLSPSPTHNLSKHQGLFQWVCSSHQVAKVLEIQLQPQSFQWIFRTISFRKWLVWSPCNPRDTQDSSPVPQFEASILQHSAFFMVQLSHLYMTIGKNHSFD